MDGGTNTCWFLSSATRDCDDDADVVQADEVYDWYWRQQWHRNANTTLADDVLDEYGVGPRDRSYHIFDSSFAGGDYATNLHKLGAHPHTLGVYSYPIVGTFKTASNNKRADLQVPVANNRIFFAGEGSHVTHPATVVGALHEGERAANDVDSVNGNPNNPPELPGGGGEFTELMFDDFESGFGNWIDGGRDASLYTGGKHATGSNAIKLQRNGSDATMTTADLSLAVNTEIEVAFEFVPKGIDAGEYFQLQVSTDGVESGLFRTVPVVSENSGGSGSKKHRTWNE